jgi:hypothetical protein
MVCYSVSQLLTVLYIKFNLNIISGPVKGYRNYTATWGTNVQIPRGLTVLQILYETYSVRVESSYMCSSVSVS